MISQKKVVVLDTNIFMSAGMRFRAIDPEHQTLLNEITPDLDRMLGGLVPLNTIFILPPTVAVELLFKGSTYDPDGMDIDLYNQFIGMLQNCIVSQLHKKEFKGEGHSQYFQYSHACEITELYNYLTRVKKDFHVEFGVDIYKMDSEESRELIADSLGVKIPNIITEKFKLDVFHMIMRRMYFALNNGATGLDSINRLGMSLFIACSIFNILHRDKGKYPLSNYYMRHNFLCDYIVFHYGLVKRDAIIVSADGALAKRGNLIYNLVTGAGSFLGVTKF